jgi:hypothetical protein
MNQPMDARGPVILRGTSDDGGERVLMNSLLRKEELKWAQAVFSRKIATDPLFSLNRHGHGRVQPTRAIDALRGFLKVFRPGLRNIHKFLRIAINQWEP